MNRWKIKNLIWKHDGNYFRRYTYIGYLNVAHRSKYEINIFYIMYNYQVIILLFILLNIIFTLN